MGVLNGARIIKGEVAPAEVAGAGDGVGADGALSAVGAAMTHADPQVLRDAAAMLAAASRQLKRIASHIESRGFVDAGHLSTVRANIDAAVARLPEQDGQS